MALIPAVTAADKTAEFQITPLVLTGSVTLEYKPVVRQVLYVRNVGVAPVTLVIDGDGVSTISLPGQGKPISNAAGYSVIVGAGQTWAITLSAIRNFLSGVVAVTGGTADVSAFIVEG